MWRGESEKGMMKAMLMVLKNIRSQYVLEITELLSLSAAVRGGALRCLRAWELLSSFQAGVSFQAERFADSRHWQALWRATRVGLPSAGRHTADLTRIASEQVKGGRLTKLGMLAILTNGFLWCSLGQ